MNSGTVSDSIHLKALQGDLAKQVFEFPETDFVLLGRIRDAAICFPDDPFISRQHLLMEICSRAARITDLSSRNGFFVNDRHFGGVRPAPGKSPDSGWSPIATVNDGDVIVVGTNRFRFHVPPLQSPISSAAPVPGSTLGRYRIVQEAERSGIGSRFQAVDTDSETPVTVTILRRGGDVSAAGADLLHDDLLLLQALGHPCLVKWLDGGHLPGSVYGVQELAEGMSLTKLLKLRGGRLALEEALPIMLDVLDGLAHGYAEGGWLHRQLKPDDIIISGQGPNLRARVSDFGIFQAVEKTGLPDPGGSDVFLEAPCYWPRERITFFTRVEPASEVFSIAALFYRILTGCLVREGLFELQSQAGREGRIPSPAEYLTLMAANRPRPIRDRDRDLSVALAEVLDKALSEPIVRRGYEDPGKTLANARFPDPVRFREVVLSVLPRDLRPAPTTGKGG